MSLYKHYVEVDGIGDVKFSVSFNKDKTNWATGQPKKLGYQASIIPVKRTFGEGYTMEETGAFTGFNTCLLEVDRQSKKRLEKAIQILHERGEEFSNYLKSIK